MAIWIAVSDPCDGFEMENIDYRLTAMVAKARLTRGQEAELRSMRDECHRRLLPS